MIIMHPEIDKNKFKNGLYIVSTPIGNLGDITFRAIEVLKNSKHIFCEDTRVTKKLTSHFNIKSTLISNHKFNESKNIKKIIELLNSGQIVSLVSDAGTPALSDPGRLIVEECVKKKINIFPIPGPSSVTAAVSVSGFSSNFFFNGFISDKKNEIEKDFKFLSSISSTIVFFISSKKFNKICKLIQKYFYSRKIVICKEITKYYEEYFRCDVKDLNKNNYTLKGEITIVISEEKKIKNYSGNLSESDKNKIKILIKKLSIKDILKILDNDNKISKSEIYKYCLEIKNEK